MGRWTQRTLALLLGVAGAAVAVEVGVRMVEPRERVQVVREHDRVSVVDGVPVWSSAYDDDRHNLECATAHPERRRIAAFGSSILFGSGVAPDETWAATLQARRDDLCVINFAQPAFAFEQELAVARQHLPELEPAVVLWEVWATSMEHFVVVGDGAYNFGSIEVGADGYPASPLPGPLHRALFRGSLVYQHLVLGTARQAHRGEVWGRFVEEELPKVLDLVPAERLVLVFAPPLEHPFAETAAHPVDFERAVLPWAEDNGVATLRLAAALEDEDVEALRLDPCCHFNAAGHRVLADVLEEVIGPGYEGRPSTPGGHHEPHLRRQGP